MNPNKLFLLLFLSLIWGGQLRSQTEGPEKESGEEEDLKWTVAFSLGYTFIPGGFEEGKESKGVYVPSIGADIYRSLGSGWSLGFVADLELANYLVEFNREDLNRERALLLMLLGSYELVPGWAIAAGGGIELEKHKNLAILRLGTTYEFKLGKGWILGPGLFFDFKEGIDTWSAAINVGKRF